MHPFLPGGPNWTIESLIESVDSPREIDPSAQGLDQEELLGIAQTLVELQQDEFYPIIGNIPTEWGLTEGDLEAVGWFLDRRRVGIADRLRALSDQST